MFFAHNSISRRTPLMGRRKSDFNGAFSSSLPGSGAVSSWLTIAVKDSGEGITPENLGRIFDPFFTTKDPGKGTGLGLAIAARIIDAFGGRIIAESEPGKGSVLTIWLPAERQ